MPLLWLSVAFLIGIIAGDLLNHSLALWIAICSFFIVILFSERSSFCRQLSWQKLRRFFPFSPAIILLFLALGGLRSALGVPKVTDKSLAYYNDRGTYILTGRVIAPPDQREDSVYIDLQVSRLDDPAEADPLLASRKITGKVRIRFPAYADWKYGDVLQFTGAPLTPADEGKFSYKDYLERQRVSTVLYYPQDVRLVEQGNPLSVTAIFERFRQKARKVIFAVYPQPESGLLAGILLGLDQDLPQSLKNAYQATGTAHIIAISGFNMSLLALLMTTIFRRWLSPLWTAILSSLLIVLYSIFVGGSPSVIRAALMAISAFGGHLLGRRQNGINALALTAALMCLVNPLLISDVSFQLSFAATLGLVLFADPLQKWLETRLTARMGEDKAVRVAKPVSAYFLFTLAAQVTTLPVIAWHFGRISISSLLANPLVLPVQPALLVGGGLSTLLGMASADGGRVLGLFVWPLAAWSNRIAEWFARIRVGNIVIDSRLAAWLIVFVIVFLLLLIFRKFLERVFKGRFYWILFLLMILNISVVSILVNRPDGYLHLDVIRAGDEATLVVRSPGGHLLVFDPGREVNELSAAVSRRISPWRFKIDEVWLTQRQAYPSVAELQERIPMDKVIMAPVSYLTGAEGKAPVLPASLPAVRLKPHEQVRYDNEMSIRVVAESETRAAVLVTYKDVKVLIPNGVDYALIKESDPDLLQNLSILVLSDEDISYIPLRVWERLNAQVVLWKSTSISPVEGWLSLDGANAVSIRSDGMEVGIEGE